MCRGASRGGEHRAARSGCRVPDSKTPSFYDALVASVKPFAGAPPPPTVTAYSACGLAALRWFHDSEAFDWRFVPRWCRHECVGCEAHHATTGTEGQTQMLKITQHEPTKLSPFRQQNTSCLVVSAAGVVAAFYGYDGSPKFCGRQWPFRLVRARARADQGACQGLQTLRRQVRGIAADDVAVDD